MLNYNAPISGSKSDIDGTGSDQMNTFHYLRKAIITARKEQYFMPMANVTNMPKHYGKTIKVHEYVPLLDERNVNDQGLDAAGATMADGNLYGSSKDIGTITGRLPVLSENGGRVNRVGFTRLTLEGSIHKFGTFYEFTDESLNFDSDPELMDHLATELMNGATQITEAALQIDLLMAANVVIFAGVATSTATITGEGGASASVVSYDDLMRLDQILTDNRTPKQTTVITGSRYTDTRVVPACRVLYVGSEVMALLRVMKDSFDNKALIEIQHYADAGTVMNGEQGAIGPFRVVQVPEMLNWESAGATVTANPGYRSSSLSGTDKYNVYPLLCIGDDSFTTIGFQTDGKSVKFTVQTVMPGKEAVNTLDPYGETGLSSIKWYYGILVKRPDRIGVIKTVAPM